ncbi:MAG: class I SAM-dependent methyltransferase [bacterium]|nr:class I SAM-dependent methyltransferase [bacterium]
MRRDLYATLYDIEERHWWWKCTRELFLHQIQRATDLRGKHILDAGCGTGMVLEHLQKLVGKNGRAEGVDMSAEAIHFCTQRNLRGITQGSLTKLPYEKETFDLVTSFDVIEHIQDDKRALAEIARVLKKGGWAAFNVPAYQWMWTGHDTSVYHYRRYTRTVFEHTLQSCGFSIVRSTYLMTLLFPIAVVRKFLLLLTKAKGELLVPPPPPPINSILGWFIRLEDILLAFMNFPFGLSVFCIARKE